MTWMCWKITTKPEELTHAKIVHLDEHFALVVDQEVMKVESEDYQLMEDAEIGMEGGIQMSVDSYWGEIINIKTGMGQMRFRSLAQVMVAVTSLPHSNADDERAFSIVWKVHTKCRQSLNTDTFTALLQRKLNNGR